MDNSHNLVQRSDAWMQARLGKVTASRVADVMALTKTGYSTSRANYMAELICERLTNVKAERFTNAAMQWGEDTEPQARASYEFMSGNAVEECGLYDHPSIASFAASPDGLIGSDGLVEIKCPNTATHIESLLGSRIDGKYITQMQIQMACTGRKWCDYCSFDPRLPLDMQLFIQRVKRDAAAIAEMETEVRKFLGELAAKIEALNAKYKVAA